MILELIVQAYQPGAVLCTAHVDPADYGGGGMELDTPRRHGRSGSN
jgi:hypothetical protein